MKLSFFFIVALSCQVTSGQKMECGIPNYPVKPKPYSRNRIVGGWEVQAHSLPWQVRIVNFFDDVSNQSYKCGGSLIQMKPGNETDLILTAAHCFYDPEKNEWSPEKRVLVVVGFHNEKNKEELAGHVFKVKRILPNYEFAQVGVAEDIALVQTETPIPYTDKTRPICLPEKEEELAVGTECFVSGWGVTSEDGPSSGTLQMVDVKVQPERECVYQVFRAVVFCAGHLEGGRDACVGDSGGPLICRVGERYAQYGIVSQGEGCARVKKPGEYTKLSMYIRWLEENVRKLEGYYTGTIKPVTRNNSSLSPTGAHDKAVKPQVPAASPALKVPIGQRPTSPAGSPFARPAAPAARPTMTTRRPYVSRFQR